MATLIQKMKALPVNFGKDVPKGEGPRGFTVTFDFTAGPGTQNFNMDNASMGITVVQSVFFDNSNNSSAATLQVNGTSQKINFPPLCQGFMPLLLSGDTGINVSVSTAGTVPIPITFLNVPHDGIIYSSQGNIIVGTVAVSGTVTANNPTLIGTDKHSNIAVGGTSVQVMAANGNRKGFFIQNPTDEVGQNIAAREPLFIYFGGAAGVDDGISIELQPGGSLAMGAGGVPTASINVNAATTNHRFIAWEWN